MLLAYWTLFAAFLVLAPAGLALLTIRQARRAERQYPPAGQFVVVNGLRLHYVRQGQTGMPAVVLLHGSEGFWQDFEAVLPLLSRHYDVIAFDRPGHGYSDTPDLAWCAPDMQADIVHQALRQMGVHKPLLVGHSWSGALLMAYAVKYPGEAAGLTLLAGWLYAPAAPPLWLFRIPDIPLLGPLCAATLLVLVKGYFLRKSLVEAFAPDPVPAGYARLAAALWQRRAGQARAFARENIADRPAMRAYAPAYPDIQIPVVIVAGEQDTVVPPAQHARRLHAALPASEMLLLPDTGHELPQTRSQATFAAINRCHALAEARRSAAQSAEVKEAKSQKGVMTATSSPTRNAGRKDADSSDAQDNAPTDDRNSDGIPRAVSARARELVMRYGWNAMSYQILNPAMEHWFSADKEAVVGFMRRNGTRVVAGAPVCRLEKLAGTIAEFEQTAAQQGETVCYFGASTRLQGLLAQLPGHDMLVLGAQPVWTPASWPGILKKNSSLRAQVSRARNKGVVVEEWTAERACNDPGLQRCLDEWMATHPLPPLHFLTEAVSLDSLTDRRLFVASLSETKQAGGHQKDADKPLERRQNGVQYEIHWKERRKDGGGQPDTLKMIQEKEPDADEITNKETQGEQTESGTTTTETVGIVGFLIATPIPDRQGWLVEQIARGRCAPNGTAELLVDAMMRAFGEEGFDYVTLGLAPLTRRAGISEADTVSLRPWLRLLLRWVRAHGKRFYNFEGLDAFKAKFRPDTWEPLYAISNETRFSPRTLYAVAAAFSDGPPLTAIFRAAMAALKQELVWLRMRLHSEKHNLN